MKEEKIYYVIGTDDDQYIKHLGGEWGPEYLPVDKISEAMTFLSFDAALFKIQYDLNFSKAYLRKLKPIEIKVTYEKV
jgi:hypothetical protein